MREQIGAEAGAVSSSLSPEVQLILAFVAGGLSLVGAIAFIRSLLNPGMSDAEYLAGMREYELRKNGL